MTDDFTAYTATVRDTFMSLGKTFLGDTNVSGRVNIDGTLTITENSINVIGNPYQDGQIPTDGILYLQNSPLANLIDLFDGAVTIDKFGTITTKGDVKIGGNLEIDGAITITAKAGETIKVGEALYISAPGIVRKADATNEAKATVVGIAANDAPLNQAVTIIIGGKAKGLKALQVGRRYYLGANALITPEIPTNAVKTVVIGIAFSLEELIIQLAPDALSADPGTLSQQ